MGAPRLAGVVGNHRRSDHQLDRPTPCCSGVSQCGPVVLERTCGRGGGQAVRPAGQSRCVWGSSRTGGRGLVLVGSNFLGPVRSSSPTPYERPRSFNRPDPRSTSVRAKAGGLEFFERLVVLEGAVCTGVVTLPNRRDFRGPVSYAYEPPLSSSALCSRYKISKTVSCAHQAWTGVRGIVCH